MRKNIIFFSRLFYPNIGGVEKHVFEISKLLIKKDYKVTIITENTQSLPTVDNIDRIQIIRINTGKEGSFKKIRIWINLLQYISLFRSADIIHCHDIFFWYLPFRFIFPFKKVFTTFHGYEANEIPNRKSILMHKIAEKLSNGNICVGEFFNKWYGTKPTIITYGAVNKLLIKQSISRNKTSNRKAMFLGRLENETGIMSYLKAIKKLGIGLDIFGNGSLEKDVKLYIKNNNLNVKLKGFVFNATDYIKDYEYVFTSRYLGILEAMAVKKPIFTEYNNQIKKDYLEMTPFAKYISISSTSDEIVREFKNYINNKSNINIDKGYDWVKDKTWESMVENYLRLWKVDNLPLKKEIIK